MTAPLTDPQCDCRGLAFMPLDVVRLRESDLTALSTGDEFKAAVLLWCAAWNQVPAASLPDDDRILARLAGYSLAEWRGMREMALKGWVQCDDGRLYHPVVSDKAMEAWASRTRQKERAAKRWHNRDTDTGTATGEPPDYHGTEEAMPRHGKPDATAMQGTGTVKGQKNKSPVPIGTDGEPSSDDPIERLRGLPIETSGWRLALHVLTDRGGMPESKARTFLGSLKSAGLSPQGFWDIGEAAWKANTPDPLPYMKRVADEHLARALAGGITAPSERQQRAWAEDWRDRPHQWRTHERGPRPGEPGCRIAPAILAELGIGRAA